MIRHALPFAAIACLAGCAADGPPMSDPTPPVALECHTERAQGAVGRTATPAVVEQARRDAGAESARVLKPDQMVTMEYREGRLNIYVDARNVITRVACG